MLVLTRRYTQDRLTQVKHKIAAITGRPPNLDDTNTLLDYISHLESELAYYRWLAGSGLADSDEARARFRTL